MAKSKIILFVLIISLSFVSAICDSNQIDVNSASLSKLDELIGIGPAKAQAIIDTRPFSSVDDLDKVYGIGPATLEKIKSQGLACVENEQSSNEESKKTVSSKEEIEISSKTKSETTQITAEVVDKVQSESIINLGVDTVKEETIYESKNDKVKKNLLVGFCVFLIGLIFLLTRK